MLYPVSDSATNLSQPAGNASLIVNQGSEPVYLDKGSTVSPDSYSILLAANQSFNWSGGELWGVCAVGAASTVSLMAGANTSVSPITNATLTGPVTVDTIIGNVNVDGSTVDIGNNVRLWGGGDYLGTKALSILGADFYDDTILATFPNIANQKYSSITIVASLTSLATFSPVVSVGLVGSGTRFICTAQLAGSNATNSDFFHTFECAMHIPLLQDPANMMIHVDNFRTATVTLSLDAFGSYNNLSVPVLSEAGTDNRAWEYNHTFTPAVITNNIDFYFGVADRERTVYIKPVGGAVVTNVYATVAMPDTGGFATQIVILLAASIAAGAALKYVIPPSATVQGIRISAGANTATSYLVFVS